MDGRLIFFFIELSEYQQQKRLTFSSKLTSPRFPSPSPRLPFPFHDLVSPFPNVSVHCAPPHHHHIPCFPFPSPFLSLEEGQVQGSPITQRGLRKLYGFCPRGCHLGLSSGRWQVLSAATASVPAPQTQLGSGPAHASLAICLQITPPLGSTPLPPPQADQR